MQKTLQTATAVPFPELEGYRVVGHIGEGGYGHVFEATQLSTGQRVAIKMLKLDPEADAQKRNYQIARFERETQLCAELNHPHIVALLDKGLDTEGTPFAVFEFIQGTTLKDLIIQRSGLSATETGELMGQVLDALAAAHQRGIVHRDLKLENLMLVSKEDCTNIKIVDFGLAKASVDNNMVGAPS